jgi:NADPH2:quinone reductase
MKAVVIHQYGPPQSFVLEDRPCPVPGPGEVRIRIAASGISFVDLLTAAGRYQITPPLPLIPGSEIAGTVDAVGNGVHCVKPGDRVCGVCPFGGWAEFVCVPEAQVLAVPEGMAVVPAAVLQVPYSTALLGARVIAGASTVRKRETAVAAGDDVVVDTAADDWPRILKAANQGRGIDIVLDPVGGTTAEAALRALAWGGRHLVVAFVGGAIPSISANLALLRSASMIGVNAGAFEQHEPVVARRTREQLCRWFREGRLTPLIARAFPLVDFAAATAQAANRDLKGRVLLRHSAVPHDHGITHACADPGGCLLPISYGALPASRARSDGSPRPPYRPSGRRHGGRGHAQEAARVTTLDINDELGHRVAAAAGGSARDLAPVMVLLASDMPRFFTGQVFPVAGSVVMLG